MIPSEERRSEHPAYLLDTSGLGVRIKSDAALVPGQTILVVSIYAEPCRVVWIGEKGPKQNCEAGLEFLRPSKLTAPQ